MKCLTATFDCAALPSNRVVSWIHAVNEEDPTFVHFSSGDEEDEEVSEESSEELIVPFDAFSQPDRTSEIPAVEQEPNESESELMANGDPELEALKKRFEKYLTKRDTSIDVGSYDIADPFIDDTMETLDMAVADGKEADDSKQNISSLKFSVVGWNSSTNAPNLTAEQSMLGKRTKPTDKPALTKERKPKKAKLSQSTMEPASQKPEDIEEQSQPSESAAATKPKGIDYELDIALVEFYQAQEAFVQATSQKTITDRTKFPASLQLPLWNFTKWQIISNPEHLLDEEQLAQLVVRTLPFSPGSVKKLLFKIIVPEMLAKMAEENKATLDKLKKSLQQKQAKPKEDLAADATQPAPDSQEPRGVSGMQIDETEKRLLYDYLRGEFDLFTLKGAISKLEEPQATIPTEFSFRRSQYQKTQSDLNDALTSSFISAQYTSYKKRIWRKVCKELKT